MPTNVKSLIISPLHYEKYLQKDLKDIAYKKERNVFLALEPLTTKPLWANTIWQDLNILPVSSIKDAAKQLSSICPLWYHIPFNEYRRSELIQANLIPKKLKRINYTSDFIVSDTYGEWTMYDKNTILYSLNTSHPYPLGWCEFVENKNEPPSRAYLKLWEVFSFHVKKPAVKDVVIDLGSSPGGWTWVLKDLAKKVYSIDTAAINLSAKNIDFQAKDAFQLDPKNFNEIQYLFSDMACDPMKLLELIKVFIKETNLHTCVCTIKLSDSIDEKKICTAFLELQPSKIVHLYHNRHELTWIYQNSP